MADQNLNLNKEMAMPTNNRNGNETRTESTSADVVRLIKNPYQLERKVEDAIRYIMYHNTIDFKDFHFQSNVQIVLFNVLCQKIQGRMWALKANRIKGDFKTIVKVYRSVHSKADDIEFLISSFYEMQLLFRKLTHIKKRQDKATDKAGRVPESLPISDMTPVVPEPDMRTDSKTVQDNESMRRNSVRRFVRFKNVAEVCEYLAESDIIKEE